MCSHMEGRGALEEKAQSTRESLLDSSQHSKENDGRGKGRKESSLGRAAQEARVEPHGRSIETALGRSSGRDRTLSQCESAFLEVVGPLPGSLPYIPQIIPLTHDVIYFVYFLILIMVDDNLCSSFRHIFYFLSITSVHW